jgi:hypothetical protein
MNRDELRGFWFGSTKSDEEKLAELADMLGLAPSRGELERTSEIKVWEMMARKLEEADEAIEDYLTDQYVELFRPDLEDEPTPEALQWIQDRRRGAESRLVLQTLKRGTVWAMGTLNVDPHAKPPTHAGVRLYDWEFYDERPRTPLWDPTSSWENWPLWYVLYEGEINGGDSVLIEMDRTLTERGRIRKEDRDGS